jgi:hypothetical protein
LESGDEYLASVAFVPKVNSLTNDQALQRFSALGNHKKKNKHHKTKKLKQNF